MAEDTSASKVENNETDDRPVVELFVRAAVDKMKNGGCPICHRYFMAFYLLREKGLIDLVVTTFLPEIPPKEVLEFSNGRRYPLVLVHKGIDAKGQDMSGIGCETLDEIENVIERFACDDMHDRKNSKPEAKAERVFEDLLKKFNIFIRDRDNKAGPMIRVLERIDGHLRENGTKFLIHDHLARADCICLPVVQHIRVAGKAYKNFEIPTELIYLWRYLRNAYETESFKESCPADREIIVHYEGKASCNPTLSKRHSQLLGEGRTFSVPDSIDAQDGNAELARDEVAAK